MTDYRILYADGSSREVTAYEALAHQVTIRAAGELQARNPPDQPDWTPVRVAGEAETFFNQRHAAREGGQ